MHPEQIKQVRASMSLRVLASLPTGCQKEECNSVFWIDRQDIFCLTYKDLFIYFDSYHERSEKTQLILVLTITTA